MQPVVEGGGAGWGHLCICFPDLRHGNRDPYPEHACGGDVGGPLGTLACRRPRHQGAGSSVCQLSSRLRSRAGSRRGQGSQELQLGCKHARIKLQPLMFLGKAARRELWGPPSRILSCLGSCNEEEKTWLPPP